MMRFFEVTSPSIDLNELTFEYVENSKPEEEYWVYPKLIVRQNDEEIGYMRVVYLPSRVFDTLDTDQQEQWSDMVDSPEPDYVRVNFKFRRNHIGEALYLRMAQELGKKGLRLYASSAREPEAILVWSKLEKNGLVAYDENNRQYIRGN